MSRHSGRNTRKRVAAPLDIRGWVTEFSTEAEIYEELDRRIRALQHVGEASADVFLEGTSRLVSATLRLLGRGSEAREFTPDERALLIRAIGADIAAGYWTQREYRRGVLLPPIMTAGVPWDTLPDHIHVLDLSAQDIRAAASRTSSDVALLSSIQRQLTAVDDVPFLIGAAHRIIRQRGPWAVLNPIVPIALFHCLIAARYARDSEEAQHAARYADSLLDGLRPNLRQRRSRTPARLLDMQEQFRVLLDRSLQLKHLLDSGEPLRVTLAKSRDWFGARVDGRDLDRWRSMTADAIATELIRGAQRGRRGISEKSLRDYRHLAYKAQEIDETWHGFITYLHQRPERERRHIETALPLISSPPAPSEEPSA
jgi:hypothetical protein